MTSGQRFPASPHRGQAHGGDAIIVSLSLSTTVVFEKQDRVKWSGGDFGEEGHDAEWGRRFR